jgi:hypothetical protein
MVPEIGQAFWPKRLYILSFVPKYKLTIAVVKQWIVAKSTDQKGPIRSFVGFMGSYVQ